MKKPDLNFSKHVAVPDEWIEKALAIPSSCASPAAPPRRPRVFFLGSRRLIAAASIVLVAALSVSGYFLIRNIRGPSAVAPYEEATVTAPTVTAPIAATDTPDEPTAAGVPAILPTLAEPSTSESDEPPTQAQTLPSSTIPTVPGPIPARPDSYEPTAAPDTEPALTTMNPSL